MVAALYDIFGPGLYIDEALDDLNFMSQARISLNIRARATAAKSC